MSCSLPTRRSAPYALPPWQTGGAADDHYEMPTAANTAAAWEQPALPRSSLDARRPQLVRYELNRIMFVVP